MKQSMLLLFIFISINPLLWAYNIGNENPTNEVPKGKSKELVNVHIGAPKVIIAKNTFAKITANNTAKSTTKTHLITKKMYQDDLLYETPQFTISKAYPNPAREVAYMSYNLQQDLDAKVTIRNLLGKVIKEYDLSKGNHEIKIPTMQFDSGVYFYTLSINGKSLKAKKLIVE